MYFLSFVIFFWLYVIIIIYNLTTLCVHDIFPFMFIFLFQFVSISYSCFMNTSIHVAFLVHIYILSYHVFQLTLTKQLVHLVQQFNFQTRCGHQIPLNSIWLYSRLNELSIESKNTHNGVLTKGLCKLQAVTKISNSQHLQQQQQPLSFVIFGDLNLTFDTGLLY